MSQKETRQALKNSPDGLTAGELSKALAKEYRSIISGISGMPDVYVDRWQPARGGKARYIPVYMLADIPEDAPMPD